MAKCHLTMAQRFQNKKTPTQPNSTQPNRPKTKQNKTNQNNTTGSDKGDKILTKKKKNHSPTTHQPIKQSQHRQQRQQTMVTCDPRHHEAAIGRQMHHGRSCEMGDPCERWSGELDVILDLTDGSLQSCIQQGRSIDRPGEQLQKRYSRSSRYWRSI